MGGRPQIVRLTAGKGVINTALRWIPFFLPTLVVAFDTTTTTLTTILGVGEMAGLSTLFVGRYLDGGRERVVMTAAMAAVGLSAVIALSGSIGLFAASFLLLILGVSLYTVAGHTYLSRRVPFAQRGRAIGLFEISWASALLVGAPIVAVLIELFGWRGPFVAVAIACAATAIWISRPGDTSVPTDDSVQPTRSVRLDRHAWVLVAASAATATAGLTTIVIAGTWLDDQLGVSTGGIGLVAMAFGAAELAASAGSASFADRVGKLPSTRLALVAVLVGLVVMTQAGSSLLIGATGLLVFFVGFEYAIVTSFSIVSESMPAARGRVLAVNNGVGTLARGMGTVSSGVLYAHFGIVGPAAVSMVAVLAAIALLTVGGNSEVGAADRAASRA
jgi:predicted MFS family arabinose efflux permease